MNSMTYSASDTFSAITSLSISVQRSALILVFFNAACHANLSAVRKQAGSSSYFQTKTSKVLNYVS